MPLSSAQLEDIHVPEPETEFKCEPDFTPPEWREYRNVSSTAHHNMKKRGMAPEELRVPGTRIIRITRAADRAWEQRMKALNKSAAAKLERERRSRQSIAAGKAAYASPKHITKRKQAK